MPLDHAGTEAVYDRIAEAIDKARTMGAPDEMESMFLAKLAFIALRELGDPEKAGELVDLALRDLDRTDP